MIQYAIGKALERLQAETNEEIKAQVIDDVLGIILEQSKHEAAFWPKEKVWLAGIRLGAAAAYTVAQRYNDATHELQELNTILLPEGEIDG